MDKRDRYQLDPPTPQAIVQVGKPVEIKNQEAHELHYLAQHMEAVSRKQGSGWFLDYMAAHKNAHQVLKVILTRSHAN